MTEFLLEIYSEEIPAKMQINAVANFKRIFIDFFSKEDIKIKEDDLKVFISTRRISLYIAKINEYQILESINRVGPRIDANEKSVLGFCSSIGVKSVKDLQVVENEKGKFYSFKTKEEKISLADVLQRNLPKLLQKMSNFWPKTMKWQNKQLDFGLRWVRPIRSILAIFNGKIINFQFSSIKSSNATYGHNLLSKKKLEINNFLDYKKQLIEHYVIFDQEQRKRIITEEIKKISDDLNLNLVDELSDDNLLLKESVGLVDFPNIAIGKIDVDFMRLPKEILVLSAKLNQKYFCLEDKKGNLAPYFIFISNVKISDKIIQDNEKVLRARLTDAKFFIDEDLKINFEKRVKYLKNISFYKKAGTIYDKITRIDALNKLMAFWIAKADLSICDKLAFYAKNDLTTKCLAEFPDLQGTIGAYYCNIQGEDPDLCYAISEQYLPNGNYSKIPNSPLGSLLALSDKIDSVCVMFLIGNKPTSSKDPLALRRMTLGIIRIIVENNYSIPLKIVIEKSINNYSIKLLKLNYPEKSNKELKQLKRDVYFEVIKYILDRTKTILKDSFDIRPDIINVLIDSYLVKVNENKNYDINKLFIKAKFINEFIGSKSSHKIISLYKRVVNILKIEEKNDNKIYNSKPHILMIHNKYEKNLFKKTKAILPKVKKFARAGNYKEIFSLFEELEDPLDQFFINIKVNADDKLVRENRLLILAKIRLIFNNIFDFSKIET